MTNYLTEMEDFIRNRRINDSYKMYDDIKELFEIPEHRMYMITVLSLETLESLLEELLSCFEKVNDIEKCNNIKKWQKIVNNESKSNSDN